MFKSMRCHVTTMFFFFLKTAFTDVRGLAVVHTFKKLKTPRPRCTRWAGSSSRGPGPGPHGSGSGLFCCSALLSAGPQCGWLHGPEREEGEERCLISNVRGTQQLNSLCCFQMFLPIMGGGGANEHRCLSPTLQKDKRKKKSNQLSPSCSFNAIWDELRSQELRIHFKMMTWVDRKSPAKNRNQITLPHTPFYLCVCACMWKSLF